MARVALVTGGTRGIGKAISARLKADGFKVAANYAGNTESAEAAAKELGISVYKWDVGDETQCADGIAKVVADLGPIDVLVNNAGITRDGQFHKMSVEKWRDVIRVDLDSLFYMTRPVIEGMRDRGFGRIINISSINGQKGQFGQVNYSAAKAGMIGFTKALAQESAAKGVTVNVVAPGYIDTDMVAAVPEDALKKIIATIPVGRLGKAEEIAAMVAFLASDQAAFITGATMTVNGAQYIAG
ncbi:acetoacetyl-CoA reductase [Vitreimonas sp.]|jgi:acetoacetyl-CoA reductase|uniref:acetoacetyl-CoA reductase n=1 Tax=Vitreimonas sp. TaxID=3069702 RepID=UPI002ED8F47D